MNLKQRKTFKKNLAIGLLSLSFIACQKSQFQLKEEGISVQEEVDSQKGQCELDPVDYNLKTSVYAFELTDKAEVNFGFNLLTDFLKVLGLEMRLKRGVLDLRMTVTDPVNTSVLIADVAGQGTFYDNGLGAKVNLGEVALGFSFFHQTRLAKLTQGGLEDGFKNVISSLNALPTTWQSKVTKVIDEQNVVLSVGYLAGLQVGDQFDIYNVENIWQGSPCQSQLLISQKLSDLPLAVAEAVQVDAHATVLRVRFRNFAERIESGALVEVRELKKTQGSGKRALLKSMRIVGMQSPPLIINDVKVNLAEYLKNQLGPIIRAKGFYLHE